MGALVVKVTREMMDEWLEGQGTPSMVGMALDFGVDPGSLGDIVRGEVGSSVDAVTVDALRYCG